MKTEDTKNVFKYILLRELNFLFKKRRFLLLFSTLIPLCIFFLLLIIFKSGTLRDIPVTSVNNDNTQMSRDILRMVDASPSVKITHNVNSYEEAKKLMLSGEVFGIVIVPKDFQKDLLSKKNAAIETYITNKNIITATLITKAVTGAAGTFSAKAETKSYMMSGRPSYVQGALLSPVRIVDRLLFNPYVNYQYFLIVAFIPSILQLFIMGSIIYSLMHEIKKNRADDFLPCMQKNSLTVFMGKTTPYLLNYFIMTLFFIFVIVVFVGVPVKGSVLRVFLGAAAFMISCLGWCGVLILFADSLRMAVSNVAVFAGTSLAFLGVTFPYASMPKFAQFWANLLPATHLHIILNNEMFRGGPSYLSYRQILFLLASGLFLTLMSAYVYKKKVENKKNWGKL